MKKSIISLLMVASFSYASNFMIVIDNEKNDYDVVEKPLWVDIDPDYSSWVDTGDYKNCDSWLPSINQQKTDFNQSANCDVEQERTKYNRQENTIDGTIRVISEETETQYVRSIVNREVNVSNETPILEKNNYNCDTWSPETSTVYYGTTFEQERYCDIDLMQKWNYHSDSIYINSWEERYTEHSGYETQNVNGTKKHPISLRSCGYDVTSSCTGHSSRSYIKVRDGYTSVGRGWGIMVLDPNNFSIKSYNHFDNHLTPALSDNMATLLNNVKNGDLVVIATYDQPSYINQNFINSMVNNLGASSSSLNMIMSEYRSSYGIISYKKGNKISEKAGPRYTYQEISELLPK